MRMSSVCVCTVYTVPAGAAVLGPPAAVPYLPGEAPMYVYVQWLCSSTSRQQLLSGWLSHNLQGSAAQKPMFCA
jgi:hypothetical protein